MEEAKEADKFVTALSKRDVFITRNDIMSLRATAKEMLCPPTKRMTLCSYINVSLPQPECQNRCSFSPFCYQHSIRHSDLETNTGNILMHALIIEDKKNIKPRYFNDLYHVREIAEYIIYLPKKETPEIRFVGETTESLDRIESLVCDIKQEITEIRRRIFQGKFDPEQPINISVEQSSLESLLKGLRQANDSIKRIRNADESLRFSSRLIS